MIWMDVDVALSKVPVNVAPLTDDTDFKSLETSVAYNASGMALYWHFVTTAGAYTVTAVTPTTSGVYDWAHQNQAMYSIEIPASGGASINNDTEGFGWFTGFATGVLPWRGPTIGFRDAALNNLLIDSPMNANRGLAGTAVPDAAAGTAGTGLALAEGAVTLTAGAVTALVAAVWAAGTRSLTTFGTLVADIWASASRTLSSFGFTVDVNPVELTAQAQADVVGAIEAEIVDDVTGEAVKQAIVDKLLENLPNIDDLSLAAIATAVRDVDNSAPAAGSLGASVNARASQTSVDDVPTNAEFAAGLAAGDDAVLAAIAALHNLSTADLTAALAAYDGPTKAELDGAVALLATAANLLAVSKLLRADRKIDKTTNPAHWDEVLLEEGTSTELVRRELFDIDGTALADEETRIGRAIKP